MSHPPPCRINPVSHHPSPLISHIILSTGTVSPFEVEPHASSRENDGGVIQLPRPHHARLSGVHENFGSTESKTS
jgi:hypothetical protein